MYQKIYLKSLIVIVASFISHMSYAQNSCGCGSGVHGGAAIPAALVLPPMAGSLAAGSPSQSEQSVAVYGEAQESVEDASEVHTCPYGKCPCHLNAKRTSTTREVIWVKESDYLERQASDTPYELYQNTQSSSNSWSREGQKQNLSNIIVSGTKARSSAIDLYEELKNSLGDANDGKVKELLSTLHQSDGDQAKTLKALEQYNNLIDSIRSENALQNAPHALHALRAYFSGITG